MSAALLASDETITSLLSWGANPDKTDADGRTALMFAIQSKCSTTINLLAPVTKENLGGALIRLATDKVELTEEVKQLTILLKGTQVEFNCPNECHTFLKSP